MKVLIIILVLLICVIIGGAVISASRSKERYEVSQMSPTTFASPMFIDEKKKLYEEAKNRFETLINNKANLEKSLEGIDSLEERDNILAKIKDIEQEIDVISGEFYKRETEYTAAIQQGEKPPEML
jgi:hypothetical protein